MKRYRDFINEEVIYDINPIEKGLVNIFDEATTEQLEDSYEQLIGRKTELSDMLEKNEQKFTFGILKAIFKDAIEYKKRRELKKGTFKFLHRVIPMALASVFLPLAILKSVLGYSRLFNKLLSPLINDPTNKYPDFLKKFIIQTLSLAEGDYRMFMEEDWFYGIFFIDQGLKDLMKEEHLIDFGVKLSEKMSLEPDDKEVPKAYVQEELKQYIKEKFKITIVEDLRINYD